MYNSFIDKMVRFAHLHRLWRRGDAVLVACSGGPDSLALLDSLLSVREDEHILIVAAHFEHGIRGESSREDAEFVKSFCLSREVECHVGHEDVPGYARERRVSIETAARERRYEFLRRVAGEIDCPGEPLIAVAHQREDQAETVLMHVIRGAGVEGLSGMRPRSGNIIRPLLAVSRAEVEGYCSERRLSPRHDETNDETDATRNRVRRILMPLIREQFNPSIDDALCRLAQSAFDENDFVSSEAERVFGDVVRVDAEMKCCIINRERYKSQSNIIRHKILSRAAELMGMYQNLTRAHYEAVDELALSGRAGARAVLPCGAEAVVEYGDMRISRCPRGAEIVTEDERISGLGKFDLPAFGISIQVEKISFMPDALSQNEAAVDADALPFPWTVRSRRDGDAIMTESGTQKIKKIFIDRKIPRDDRDKMPIFMSGGTIFWIGGVRRANVGMVTAATKSIIRVKMIWRERAESQGNFRGDSK